MIIALLCLLIAVLTVLSAFFSSAEITYAKANRFRVEKAAEEGKKVAKMESMPVCGVAMRNEATAPFEARSFFSPMAVGITPQEHKGNGMPKRAAQSTENLLLCDRYLA